MVVHRTQDTERTQETFAIKLEIQKIGHEVWADACNMASTGVNIPQMISPKSGRFRIALPTSISISAAARQKKAWRRRNKSRANRKKVIIVASFAAAADAGLKPLPPPPLDPISLADHKSPDGKRAKRRRRSENEIETTSSSSPAELIANSSKCLRRVINRLRLRIARFRPLSFHLLLLLRLLPRREMLMSS